MFRGCRRFHFCRFARARVYLCPCCCRLAPLELLLLLLRQTCDPGAHTDDVPAAAAWLAG